MVGMGGSGPARLSRMKVAGRAASRLRKRRGSPAGIPAAAARATAIHEVEGLPGALIGEDVDAIRDPTRPPSGDQPARSRAAVLQDGSSASTVRTHRARQRRALGQRRPRPSRSAPEFPCRTTSLSGGSSLGATADLCRGQRISRVVTRPWLPRRRAAATWPTATRPVRDSGGRRAQVPIADRPEIPPQAEACRGGKLEPGLEIPAHIRIERWISARR